LWVVEYGPGGDVPSNGASPAVFIRTLPSSSAPFVRGDPTGDGTTDISDAVAVLSYLFTGGAAPGCLAAADANGSGKIDVSDAVYIVGFLFLGGAPPRAPYPACGGDPVSGPPGCAAFSACS
jgi:hypothetical protein